MGCVVQNEKMYAWLKYTFKNVIKGIGAFTIIINFNILCSCLCIV